MGRQGVFLVAIDPSTTSTGVSVFRKSRKDWKLENTFLLSEDTKPKKLLAKDRKQSKAQQKQLQKQFRQEAMLVRINNIIQNLNGILDKYSPQKIIIEDSYMNKDPWAYKMLCRLQGAMYEYALLHGAEFKTKPPSEWRKDMGFPLVENGVHNKREDFKNLAVEYVKKVFGITVIDDVAEAICLGLSETNKSKGDYEK